MWIGFGWVLTGLDAEADASRVRAERREHQVRVWTVSVVISGERDTPASAGAVVAADLELAAEQMCAHLDPDLIGHGGWYLLATRDTAGAGKPRPGTAAQLVAPLSCEPSTGAVIHGRWTVADEQTMESR
ncbi:hypothetical protein [Nocardia sp. CS682]|uniref:hypothetical protein n=1 Tax=Nocardia sp. CS682 TaxID=1047172 RepID=UPI001074BE13|nr:hypothetical protein [Nocardia sp. CS682]